ncbi:MAG: universal stress protein [Anaerolineae bacterium]
MYKRVLVVLDGSKLAEAALPHAREMARCYSAQLVLLRVAQPLPVSAEASYDLIARVDDQTLELVQGYLAGVAKELQETGIAAEIAVRRGVAHAEIVDYADQNEVDLIVMTTRGRSGFTRWLMGSVADRVVRGASVPVLLVRVPKHNQNAATPGKREQ